MISSANCAEAEFIFKKAICTISGGEIDFEALKNFHAYLLDGSIGRDLKYLTACFSEAMKEMNFGLDPRQENKLLGI